MIFRATPSVPMASLVVFTRQFAAMASAGLPMVRALRILSRETANPAMRHTISVLVRDLENGTPLAQAMQAHPQTFSRMYVNMVTAAERSGALATVLNRLAQVLERNAILSRKLKGAMLYPAIICIVATAAIVTLLVVVIPIFENIFASVSLELPVPTRVVVAFSDALTMYWWLLPLVGVLVFFLVRLYANTSQGALALARLVLRIPIAGSLLAKAAIARFSRTLATLLESGVELLEGLDITARTTGNRAIETAIVASRSSIAAGATITEPLRRSGLFPSMVLSMIAVGEEAGDLAPMLNKIADFYDAETEAAITGVLSAIEPLMVSTLGLVIGGMVTAMYLPIFDMVNVAQ